MSLLQKILGKDGNTQMGVDNTHMAARVSGRPMHLGANGAAFSIMVRSGIMAAGLAADAEIFQARWAHASFKNLLRSLSFGMWRASATAFAAGPINIRAAVARAFTADGGGGTPVVFSTANTNKKRTDFQLSKYSDTGVRFSATAALTAGTKVFDTNDFAGCGAFVGAVAPAVGVDVAPAIIPLTTIWQRNTSDEYPFVLELNEGISIRATVPATGTWGFMVGMEWAEVDPAEVEGWT